MAIAHEQQYGPKSLHPEFLKAIDGARRDKDLAGEIAALRREIAELRTALAPAPSLILCGQQAIDELKRITRGDLNLPAN